MKTFEVGDVVWVTHPSEFDEEHDLKAGMIGTVVFKNQDNDYYVEFEGFTRGWEFKTKKRNTWCLGAHKLTRVGDVQSEYKKTWTFSGVEIGGTPNDRIYGSLVYSPSEDQYYIIEHEGQELQFEIEPFDIRLESAPAQKVVCKEVPFVSYNLEGKPSTTYTAYTSFICPHCGHGVQEDYVCCPYCRTELNWEAPLDVEYEG